MITYNYTNKTVLITGSSRGVGRATALAFAAAGARVCIHFNRSEAAARELYEALPGAGHAILKADAANPQAMRVLVESAIAKLGHLDVLVNNAGVFLPHDVTKLPFEEWLATFQQTLNVNFVGAAAASYAAGRHMMARKTGAIINIGSRGAYRGEAGQPGYGASKAALHSFSQSLAQSLGPYGITVHAVAPGFIETAMARPHLQGAAGDAVRAQSPLNRVAKVEEVAQAVLYLASEAATFTTGSVMDLNGASYLH
ncbi:MAG: SDR family NAD(P)-dependent oxidoreductase [Bacteroidota bacterium]